MRTDNMDNDYYNSIIYTKQELEREFKTWRQNNITPSKSKDYIDWATINNKYVSRIENYEILKKIKSDTLIDFNKI